MNLTVALDCDKAWLISPIRYQNCSFVTVFDTFSSFMCPPDVSRIVGSEVTKPAFGCQVTIHSEQEKQMIKMYRREEKRERKRAKGTDDSDVSDAALNFDPREMRALRYAISFPFLLCFCFFLLCSLSVLAHLHFQVKARKPTSFWIFYDQYLALGFRQKENPTLNSQVVTYSSFTKAFSWKFNFKWEEKKRCSDLFN